MNWISCSNVKREARNSLRGRWGLAIGTLLIGGIILCIPNIISSFMNNTVTLINSDTAILIACVSAMIFSIIRALLDVIIGYGACDFSLNIASNNNADVKDIFSGFKYILKLLIVWLIRGIGFNILLLPVYALIIVSALYFIINSISYFGYSDGNLNSSIVTGAFAFIGIFAVLSVIVVIAVTVLDAFMSQTYYILKENDSESIMTCIKNSFKMMKGHIWNYIILNLSFIGWGILCIFTLGIGLLWLTPYTQITRAQFYLKVKEAYYYNNMSMNE